MTRKILQPFYTVYAVITFLLGLAITFPFYVFFSLGNNMAARRKIYQVVRLWARSWLFINGMSISKIGAKPASGRYIVVVNHASYLDSVLLFPALPDYFRPLGKKEFSKIPVLGFLYRQLAIMVDRSSAESRAKSMRLMWRVIKKEADIIIFPEGTFNETEAPLKEFYNGAFRLAITTQVPLLPILFADSAERWHYSAWWKIWPGRNRVVYLDPIPVTGMTEEDIPQLKDTVYNLMADTLLKYKKARSPK
jgi:1-acyl-sn-glycerol-3-phosphate acyltransferase